MFERVENCVRHLNECPRSSNLKGKQFVGILLYDRYYTEIY